MNEKNAKKWVFRIIGTQALLLTIWILTVLIVDPYFHYHKPIEGISYRLYNERYINDGIIKNFDYNAIITGTSMNQNFKTSEFDALFHTNSIKITFAGGGFQEISNNLDKALGTNEVARVLWGIDYNGLIREYDWEQYEGFPEYLYDDNVFNDVSYLLNKSIMYHGCFNNLYQTVFKVPSTTFDEYSSWSSDTGLEMVMKQYQRLDETQEMEENLTPEERKIVENTISNNIIKIVKKYPDTEFDLFYSPYSIAYWDEEFRTGHLMKQLEAEQIATEMLLEYENVNLYCFSENLEVISNLENYRDKEHYKSEINSLILKWISEERYKMTLQNYKNHIRKKSELFGNYDYNKIFEK